MDLDKNKELSKSVDSMDNDISNNIFPEARKAGRQKREIRETEKTATGADNIRLGTVPDSFQLFSILSDRGSVNLLKVGIYWP